MKRLALASSQRLALLGFFPYAISFSQSLINDPDSQIFYFIEKRLYGTFHGWISADSRLESLLEGSLFFTKFSDIAGTHFFINL